MTPRQEERLLIALERIADALAGRAEVRALLVPATRERCRCAPGEPCEDDACPHRVFVATLGAVQGCQA